MCQNSQSLGDKGSFFLRNKNSNDKILVTLRRKVDYHEKSKSGMYYTNITFYAKGRPWT